MGLNIGSSSDTVKTSLDKVLYTVYDYPQDLHPQIATAETPELFVQDTTQLDSVSYAEYQLPGAFEEVIEEEEPPIATIRTANKTTKEIKKWKKTLKISKEFYQTDQHGVVDKAIRDMGLRARTTRDKYAMDVYAGGFDATVTPDAAYLWSASHVALSGDTVDNLESGVFSSTNMETLVKTLMEQKAQDGELGGHMAYALLVPPALAPQANQVLKSELESDVTDNQRNYFSMIYPEMRIFVSPFIGSTYNDYANADTAHYLVSQNHAITRTVGESLYTELVSWIYDDFDRWTYKAGYRETSYAATWEGAVASTGTA